MRYDAGAAAYDRFVGRWSRLYAAATLEAAGVKASDRVLDLATGTGDAARQIQMDLEAHIATGARDRSG